MSNLEVYCQQFRSQLGSDSEENLIILCRNCHASKYRSLMSQCALDFGLEYVY
jgi:hypothetical protein